MEVALLEFVHGTKVDNARVPWKIQMDKTLLRILLTDLDLRIKKL